MAARRRDERRRGWPDNLYVTDETYFFWRNPQTGTTHGIGRVPLDQAKAEASEANIKILGIATRSRLVDRIDGSGDRTVGALLVRYVTDLAKKNLAENTLRTRRSQIKALEERWMQRPVAGITTADVDALLQDYIAAGKHRTAQAMRSFLMELFNKAMAIGWVPGNVAAVTERVTVTVRRARLTLPAFLAIYDKALEVCDPWVPRTMELALVTMQRREDIANWQFRDVRDGHLWNEQGKSENIEARGAGGRSRVAIPLSLRLTVTEGERTISWSLEDCIKRCRDLVVSKWMIHHIRPRTLSSPGDQVWVDTITKGFARARDATGLTWEGKEPPTFHEIRSLSLRLWREQRGRDFAQALAGHKDAKSTDVYNDSRGDWVVIKAG